MLEPERIQDLGEQDDLNVLRPALLWMYADVVAPIQCQGVVLPWYRSKKDKMIQLQQMYSQYVLLNLYWGGAA